ncbi:MAG: hypothetical protein MJ066_01525 [Clostridia bacterium]|nr:hypothetical protein [Clostridia bacterium]
MERSYWIDLIGFDVKKKEKSLVDFIKKQEGKVNDIYIHMWGSSDFIVDYMGMDKEYKLRPAFCSSFPHSTERDRQEWTNYDFREFISICHKHNIKVYLTFQGCFDRTDNGENAFKTKHPEVIFNSTVNDEVWSTYHFAKTTNDGTLLEDIFSKQIKKVLVDYDFDGLQIADCATFTQGRLQHGDFTDNLVKQFVERTKIKFPKQYGVTTKNRKEEQARYRYIMSNLRYEWSLFIADRFGEFISKIIKAVHQVKKKTTLVNAYTCSPFEGLFRFGVDYRKYDKAGMDKWMFEDAVAVTVSGWVNNEMVIDDDTRANWMYRLMEKQGALKCCTLNVHIINMTNTQDTNEQWNLVDNAPNEFRTDIAKDNATFVWKNGKLIPSHDGYLFCLSDCVEKHTWDTIHKTIDDFTFNDLPKDCLGFTALYDDDLNAELKEFISSRRHNAGYFNYEFLRAGLSICARTTKEELPKSRGPLLICAEAVRDKKTLEYLQSTDRVMIIAGYKKLLDKTPSATFTNGDLKIFVYNVNKKLKKNYAGYKKADLDFRDERSCHWPKLPRMDKFNKDIIADVVKFVERNIGIPFGINPHEIDTFLNRPIFPASYTKGRYKIFTYKMSDNHYRMLITNVENYYVHPLIKFPYPIKEIKVSGMPSWIIPKRIGDFIYAKINNRSSELFDIYI